MYSSWSTDLREYHAHQRKIVRHFAPHIPDEVLTPLERRYLIVGVTRIVVVFLVPTTVIILRHLWFWKTPVFILVAVISLVELVMAFYRYLVLWPEGREMRWGYWLDIEIAEDCYKLKILGYYHRKIAKFTGRFPSTMPSSEIRRHYRRRGITMSALFTVAYGILLTLLARAGEAKPILIWVLFLLTIGSGMVVFRFIKMHYIELPQVLILRDHPDFALPEVPHAEAIPFARPVESYQATQHATSSNGDTENSSATAL
ncbi:hypothetical protein Poli38472_005129 [Pythium oligandrum]|uniref:Uncharacterized protein n=1 Tax=Pythium oligandrum TaxID=41045 RepID=A0A8K1CFI1_PYTOL|nr:hypothetical protein Poli38472_005129 [Pythium oligandrum]|eukprot:TMW62511.1 hypothetical protein Poli38472_005129 [Pythium oligandrum]